MGYIRCLWLRQSSFYYGVGRPQNDIGLEVLVGWIIISLLFIPFINDFNAIVAFFFRILNSMSPTGLSIAPVLCLGRVITNNHYTGKAVPSIKSRHYNQHH